MSLAFNEPKYQIAAPDFRCHGCNEEVACEVQYFSAVVFHEETFQRRNYCTGCWKPEAESFFAFWRARRPALPTDGPKRVRFDTALVAEFFNRLGDPGLASSAAGEAEGPGAEERDELRFVLALLLVRKKVLLFGSSCMREGAEWLKLTARPREGESEEQVHWVRNPEMSDAQLERVKVRIGELLQMQL